MSASWLVSLAQFTRQKDETRVEIGLNCSAPDSFRYARDLGCRWAYLDFSWGEYDPAVREANDLGLDLIAAVSTERGSFPDGHWIWQGTRGMMPDPGAWREYLRAIVGRYGNVIRHWEIWSEPNCRSCNPMNYYDAELYCELLALASETIRGVDSSAQIVLGGIWLNSLTPDYVNTLFRTGAAEHFDVFNWHLYPMAPTREAIPFPLWKPVLSQWVDFFRSKLPDGCPMWMTEYGIPTRTAETDILFTRTRGEIVGLTEEEQADWFSGFAEAADQDWGIGTVIWLLLRDEDDPTHYYASTLGMLRPDGSEKPVRERIAQFQAASKSSLSPPATEGTG